MSMKLQVRDLRVSFRTTNGKVQAVRGLDFDLAEGETLAIVGESGSGKSVTSKAILGIQAANSITESGEIIYDGKDLLKISEEDFHKIRGDKISMIFQDPMSSLNPIVKIGRQLTEAMILKGRARQRESRTTFSKYLKNLDQKTGEVLDSTNAAVFSNRCKEFKQYELTAVKMQARYNNAHEAAFEADEDIEVLAFELEKKAAKDLPYRIRKLSTLAGKSVHPYVVSERSEELKNLTGGLKKKASAVKRGGDAAELIKDLKQIQGILQEGMKKTMPDYSSVGYYLESTGKTLPDMPTEELNEHLQTYLNDNFLNEFHADAKKGIEHSADVSYQNMEKAIPALRESVSVFRKENLDRKECVQTQKRLAEIVESTIDPLALEKDSLSYTFRSSVKSEISRYFTSIKKNKKAVRVHDRMQKKFDRIVKRGKQPDWKVAEAAVTDLNLVKENVVRLTERLADHFEEKLGDRDNRDYEKETGAAIEHLKTNATGMIAKVTKRIAKDRAIKLMDEVGIADPRRRYNQYPFEFSGGMRQRIVIAIALAANPDILICDEPTTALDVTIQAQILELINKLKAERHLSVIFITHDLGVVANMADRVAVMYAGKIVEYGTATEIFYEPAHPYTWALLSSMPDLDTNEKLESIPGTPPNMIYPPKGDAFAARNKYAMKIDFERQPPLFKITDTHYAATWLLHPDAPKMEMPQAVQNRITRMKEKRVETNG